MRASLVRFRSVVHMYVNQKKYIKVQIVWYIFSIHLKSNDVYIVCYIQLIHHTFFADGIRSQEGSRRGENPSRNG